MAKKTFTDLLLEKKLIDPAVLDSLRKEAKEKGLPLEDYILRQQIIKEEDFYRLKSQFLKIPFRSLAGQSISLDALKLIPVEAAQNYKFVPIAIDPQKGILEAGILNPEDVEAREALKFIAHRNNLSSRIYLISQSDFSEVIKQYSSLKSEVKKALAELEQELKEGKKITIKKPEEREAIEKIAEEAPITRVVATIINHAI